MCERKNLNEKKNLIEKKIFTPTTNYCDHEIQSLAKTVKKGRYQDYRKVESINTSRLEAPFTISRLLMKGKFNNYLLCPLKKNLIF